MLHGERSSVQRRTLRVVQDQASPGKHQGGGRKEDDSLVQDMPQTLDKERIGCALHRNNTQRSERKMETTAVDLTFQFKCN